MMLRRASIVCACVGLLALGRPAAARGNGAPVDAELIFAVDISYSMNRTEQRMQREGYAEALSSPEFLAALKSNAIGKIAVAYMQWASAGDQDVLLPWTLIDGPESARKAAQALREAPYRSAQRTSVSGAIDASVKLFENNGYDGMRQIIDVSGDGPNNNGRLVTAARDDAVAKGYTINGLPLVGIRDYRGPADIDNLDVYYEDCVIGGGDSFMVAIRDTRDFVAATRSKLVREIARGPAPLARVTPAQAREPRVSCTIGETLWRGRFGN